MAWVKLRLIICMGGLDTATNANPKQGFGRIHSREYLRRGMRPSPVDVEQTGGLKWGLLVCSWEGNPSVSHETLVGGA
ncbi:hypothetical protein DFH09DRAFT_1175612 [Mycena vulgaris]|nr:hypothetical protein DFH09DRAFT_1175612 [Mycena vulgaris]